METTRILRGACATLSDIDLCVMRVEPVGDEVWVQLLATFGPYQKVCTLRPDEPLDVPGGVRLTVLEITQAEGEEPRVLVRYERTDAASY